MFKSIASALVAAATTLGAGAAHAGHVSWSIDIGVPVVGVVVSNAPVYAPAPVYVAAPPVYVSQPVPVYREAPPVAYYSQPDVYYRPVPVAYPRYDPYGYGYARWHRHHPRWEDRGDRGDRGRHRD